MPAARLPGAHHVVHCVGTKSGRKPAPWRGSSVQHATFGGLLSRHRQHAPRPSRGLCYDKHHVRAVTVAVVIPDKLPCVLKGRSGTGGQGKPRQSLVDLSVHGSRPYEIGVSPLRATSGLSYLDSLILPYRRMVASQTRGDQVRSASVHTYATGGHDGV